MINKKFIVYNTAFTICICIVVNLLFMSVENQPTVTQTQTVNVNQPAKVNINRASLAELENLPSIGETRAKLIIKNRPYQSIYDLVNVKGIGKTIVDELEGEITVE